jgi:hypothetical protein
MTDQTHQYVFTIEAKKPLGQFIEESIEQHLSGANVVSVEERDPNEFENL